MVNMDRIRRELGESVCRRCISGFYRVDLQPEDCWYATYPHPCDHCGQIHNIVVDLKLSGKRKLLFK